MKSIRVNARRFARVCFCLFTAGILSIHGLLDDTWLLYSSYIGAQLRYCIQTVRAQLSVNEAC